MVGSLRQNTHKCASKYILGAVQSETAVLYSHQVRDLGMKSHAICGLSGHKVKKLVL